MSLGDIDQLLKNSVILLVGSPLSGKSTQGNLLGKVLKRPYVSTGDLFRQEVRSGSILGQEMKNYMDNGELIPNELTTTFLTNQFNNEIYNDGMILDGYPRNLSHLPIFDKILLNLDRKIYVAIYFNVSKTILDQRREVRSRIDDDQTIFDRRYEIFCEETIPLINFFQSRNILIDIPSNNQSIEEIHQLICFELIQFEEKKLNYFNSYKWLEYKLINDSNKRQIFNEFRQRALDENEKLGRRTGITRRIVYLRTENLHKFEEHRQIFEKLYGIEIIRVPPIIYTESDQSNIFLLLNEKIVHLVQLALITERSNLYRPGTNELTSFEHGVRAINQSKLKSFSIDKNQLIQSEFVHSTIGRIDLSKRIVNDRTIFDWDDIFIVEANGMSYHQLKQRGIKNSSRDMVISYFIQQRIHYKQLINLKFDPPPPAKRVIDFSMDVYDYILQNKSYNNPLVIEYGFDNLVKYVLNKGIFFRAANNRRQANYWSPGLNGGLPLTPKDDQIHQDTFMAHDIGHFAIPDLIYIGNNSILHKRIYIAWRMISEATTMVIADMLFVDALVKSNINYHFDKRKIYPLFKELNIDLTNSNTRINSLKQLIKANYKYCLTGDDSFYLQMMSNPEQNKSLQEFQDKFSPFFAEDYRWTEQNYQNMVQRSEQMSSWWNEMKSFGELPNTEPIQSIDDIIQQLEPNDQFIDQIFEYVFQTKIQSILDNNQSIQLLPQSQRLFKSFTKWIIGQLAITFKFHFLPDSKQVREEILSRLTILSRNGEMNIDDVSTIRLIYENYLKILLQKNLISADDEKTFCEVYPLFDPFYVNYDQDPHHYEDLSTISKRIYSLEDYRLKQINQLTQVLNRSLTTNEIFYISTIYQLIESGHGQIIDGMFVKQPGLIILSESPIHHPLGLVTFLISGISIETSMEFIAHHESKVARLTTSKTNAMNIPLFRVQGDQTLQQRSLIENLIKSHNQFQLINQPRTNWGEHGNEFYNINYPASKVTILTYTMTLEDFHKLFIGRIKSKGNEQEVIEITKRMAHLLHQKYPQLIQPIEFYLHANNHHKYRSIHSVKLIDQPSIDSIQLIGKSKLTEEANRLFQSLNISFGNDSQRLAEFRSRLTYLAFSRTPSNQKKYLEKIIHEYGHLSILDASQFIFQIPSNIDRALFHSFIFQDTFLFITFKQIRQSILCSAPTDPSYHFFTSLENFIQC